jgi:hypothetical protein
VAEITAAGAAYAAGLATGFWAGLDELRANYTITRRWEPEMHADERTRRVADRRRGVDRTLGLTAPERGAPNAAMETRPVIERRAPTPRHLPGA